MQCCVNLSEGDSYHDILESAHQQILKWGDRNRRDFPWRKTRDTYNLMIAEIMLHRTRADQVKDVYKKFIDKYPDFNSIVNAGPLTIREELHSLGLAWRAELLYGLADRIMKDYDGQLPYDKKKLMELPGIGHYIASAVLCMSDDVPEPLLDTNTVRVISRLLGIEITDSSRRSNKFKKIMSELISYGKPREFSLSLIDFAALICTARNPGCNECSLRDICKYYGGGVAQ